MSLKLPITLTLDLDTINWLDYVATRLQKDRKTEVDRSAAAEWVIGIHFRESWRRYVDQRHADKVQNHLKGSKLIRPKMKVRA